MSKVRRVLVALEVLVLLLDDLEPPLLLLVGELIRCDPESRAIAVDLRVGSPTFGQWAGGALTGEDGVILYIPEGFAHGYVCLSESADLVYKVSNEFDAALDGGIAWDDPVIGISWPVENPALSERDLSLPSLESAISPFQYEQ